MTQNAAATTWIPGLIAAANAIHPVIRGFCLAENSAEDELLCERAARAAYPVIAAAVLAEVVAELTNAGDLAAAGFVRRMTEEQQ